MVAVKTHSRRKCQAKNPATCPHHGVPVSVVEQKRAAIGSLFENAKKVVPVVCDTKSSLVDNAVKVRLGWDGAVPDWWDGYVDGLDSLSKPEILDVVDTPHGRKIVVWKDQSDDEIDVDMPIESGLFVRVCEMFDYVSGERDGFVKLAVADEDAFKMSFGDDEFTYFRWASRYDSLNVRFLRDKDSEVVNGDRFAMSEVEKEQFRVNVWVEFNRSYGHGVKAADGSFVAGTAIKPEHAPAGEELKSVLAGYSDFLKQKATHPKTGLFTEERKMNPGVDYSKIVNEDMLGCGYGSALYVYAARQLARKYGVPLRGSGFQSDEAVNMWDRFKKLLPQHVKPVVLGQGRELYNILDFTSDS